VVGVRVRVRIRVSSFIRSKGSKDNPQFKNGVMRGRQGHSRSSAVSPFDIAHTTSYWRSL